MSPTGTENSNIQFYPPRRGGFAAGRNKKNRTDWDLRPIMSCSNTSPVLIRIISFFSPKNPILYLAGRSSDSVSTLQTPSRLSPVAFACSSTLQQRSCRRFALRSLFTCALHTGTCKLPIFCFWQYYSTPRHNLQYAIPLFSALYDIA